MSKTPVAEAKRRKSHGISLSALEYSNATKTANKLGRSLSGYIRDLLRAAAKEAK